MKKLIITSILISLFLLTGLKAQLSSNLTLVSKFQPLQNMAVILDIQGENEIKYWNHDYVKVEVKIKTSRRHKSTLANLKDMGRYNIKYSQDYFSLLVEMPNSKKLTKVNGNLYEEKVTYTVYLPKGLILYDLNNMTGYQMATLE